MKNRAVLASVIKVVSCVFVLAILGLAAMGVHAALGNDRPIIAVLLAVMTLWLVVSGILTARRVLHQNDPEAYELRRYD